MYFSSISKTIFTCGQEILEEPIVWYEIIKRPFLGLYKCMNGCNNILDAAQLFLSLKMKLKLSIT